MLGNKICVRTWEVERGGKQGISTRSSYLEKNIHRKGRSQLCTRVFLASSLLTVYLYHVPFQMAWLPSGRFSSPSSVMKTSSSGWPARSTKRSRTHPSFCQKQTKSTKSSLTVRHQERCVCVCVAPVNSTDLYVTYGGSWDFTLITVIVRQFLSDSS